MTTFVIKKFLKDKYGITVTTRAIPCKDKWMQATINPVDGVYVQQFPPELGRTCMGVVYKGCEGLDNQEWGGNIDRYSLCMVPAHWEEVIKALS